MGEFEYEFEELPLIAEGEVVAGLLNGTATIRFDNEGDWHIAEISLESFGPKRGERGQHPVRKTERSWLYATIAAQLQRGARRSRIEDRIAQELDEYGDSLPPMRAMHSTLNRAQQGI